MLPHPALHYDMITEAWMHIFGDNFHFGYFASQETTLEEATDALIDELAKLGTITQASRVADIGCGIGNPAFYLYRRFGCSILGISTSAKGIEVAAKTAKALGCADKVRFQVADGTQTGLPDNAFDVVWLMESSHLMNKKRLFGETYRILKPGGQLLLCDVICRKRPSLPDHLMYLVKMGLRYPASILSMKRAFGRGKTETFDFYKREPTEAGFVQVEAIDISAKVLPTISCWKANITEHRDRILKILPQEEIDHFVSASDLLEDLYRKGFHGYGLVRAVKR
jgi:27-O-demethylrifamycin SV methyltransferase